LKVVTYNVWFGTRKESVQELLPRLTALFGIVAQYSPDVVCLQEMTKPILDILLQQSWVREHYWVSDQDIEVGRYKVVMLSRLPLYDSCSLSTQELPSTLGRSLLKAKFQINGENVLIATSHLESYDSNSNIRKQQLKVIYRILAEKNTDHAFMMGDFNFANSHEREKSIHPKFMELWPTVQRLQRRPSTDMMDEDDPENEGFTYDAEKNLMLKEMLVVRKEESVRKRIDLILYRSKDSRWGGVETMVLGTQKIGATGGGDSGTAPLYPSDHFGVYGKFQYSAVHDVL